MRGEGLHTVLESLNLADALTDSVERFAQVSAPLAVRLERGEQEGKVARSDPIRFDPIRFDSIKDR